MIHGVPDESCEATRPGVGTVAPTRRDRFKAMGVGVAWALARLESAGADDAKKPHVVTLSFDDGFKKSSLRTAEIKGFEPQKAVFNFPFNVARVV
jgi:hypothetical protein